jgi:hypothetical protein
MLQRTRRRAECGDSRDFVHAAAFFGALSGGGQHGRGPAGKPRLRSVPGVRCSGDARWAAPHDAVWSAAPALRAPAIKLPCCLAGPFGHYPTQLGGESHNDRDPLVHWCHGATGAVFLFSKAYQVGLFLHVQPPRLVAVTALPAERQSTQIAGIQQAGLPSSSSAERRRCVGPRPAEEGAGVVPRHQRWRVCVPAVA